MRQSKDCSVLTSSKFIRCPTIVIINAMQFHCLSLITNQIFKFILETQSL